MSWLLGAVIAVAMAALLLLLVTLVLLAPVWRKRQEVAAPAVLWRASAAPARALPGPQTVNFNFYGVPQEQAAQEIAALRDAGHQVFDTYRREQ